MGQKVNPKGLRYGINRDWESRWFAKDKYETAKWLIEDDKIRKYLTKEFRKAMVDRIEIERSQTCDIYFYVSQTPLVHGGDAKKEALIIKEVNKIVGRKTKVNLNVIEVQNPDLSAAIIAREIADQIENRVSFRIAQKSAMRKVMKAGAKGIKTHVSGRLGGAEIARDEGYSEGVVPMTTLRADIDYALAEAKTSAGQIGCKVWINRGQIFRKKVVEE